jgi:hypothetical protein
VLDVALGLLAIQRLDAVLHADALTQRTKLGAREQFFELGLPGQANVHEVAAAPLQVGEQTHFLEQLGREVLRFVDDQDAGVAAIEPLAEGFLQALDQGRLAEIVFVLHAEAMAHLFEQLAAR